MPVRYVGPGGSDGNSGISWALRKLTLNGVEDTPVVAGDIVYVGPGVYRESLTLDVSGASGNPIQYIADVTGEKTDGVGGIVRHTGANSAEVPARGSIIYTGAGLVRNYRTFRGFRYDGSTNTSFNFNACDEIDGWIIEDCTFGPKSAFEMGNLDPLTAVGNTFTIRRCIFDTPRGRGIRFYSTRGEYNYITNIENCVFHVGAYPGIHIWDMYGGTIKNCTFYNSENTFSGENNGLEVDMTNAANKVYVYNCVFVRCDMEALDAASIEEDYTVMVPYQSGDRLINVTDGANTVYRPAGFNPPLHIPGFYLPFDPLEPASWSALVGLASGNSPPGDDLFGLSRPVMNAKRTRGAIQYNHPIKETTIVPSGEDESMEFFDALIYQIFVPTTGKAMSFSVEVYRGAAYTNTNPQMTLRQPGQTPRTTTDTEAAEQWNELSDSFTPATSHSWVVMELRSNNTALAGDYKVYFGKFRIR